MSLLIPTRLYTQGCRVYHNANQTIPTSTFTWLAFNREDYDTDNMHDLITNNERITIKTAGIYIITFHGTFTTNDTGYRRAMLYLNAATVIGHFQMDATAICGLSLNLTTLQQLNVGDYLRLRVWQNKGDDLEFLWTADYSPYFMAQRVG